MQNFCEKKIIILSIKETDRNLIHQAFKQKHEKI